MIRRKLLFWPIWLVACPFVWLYYATRRWGYNYHLEGMPGHLTGLVRQSVWDKLVAQKDGARNRAYHKRRIG